MPISDVKPIKSGDFVNEAKDSFNAAIKQLPVNLSISPEGLLTITLFGNELLTCDLSIYFPSRLDVASTVAPGSASFQKPGLVQFGDDENPDDLESERKVLPAAAIVRLVNALLDKAGPAVKQSLQQVTEEGNITTRFIQTAQYQTPLKEAVQDFIGVCIWQQIGQNARAVEMVTVDDLRKLIVGQTANIKTGIGENTCQSLTVYILNTLSVNVAGTVALYIDNKFKTNLTASAVYPEKATLLGVPATTLLKAVWPTDTDIQDNKVHLYTLRHTTTGEILASASSPGNCSIINPSPKPKLVRVGSFIESAVPVQTNNQPPVAVKKISDLVVTAKGDTVITKPAGEFSDPEGDAIEVETVGVNGLPDGVTYDKATDTTVVAGRLANGISFVLGRRWKDAFHDWQGPYWWKNTIGRPDDTPLPVRKYVAGDLKIYEGGATGTWIVIFEMSDGSKQIKISGFTAYWKTSYPNGCFLSVDGKGAITASVKKDTLEGDAPLVLGVRLDDTGEELPGFNVLAVNEECFRPNGTTYQLAWNFTPKFGTPRLFDSLDDANNTAGAKFDNTKPGEFNSPLAFGTAVKLEKGEPFYLGVGTDCNRMSDNIYYVIANGGVNTVKKAVKVKNGVIDDIKDSTYTTPVTPTPTTPCDYLKEVAYKINSKGNGQTVDSLGFYYLGLGVNYVLSFQSRVEADAWVEYTRQSNAPNQTLTGSVSRYNHMIVQAYANESWQDGDSLYKVKLEIYKDTAFTQLAASAVFRVNVFDNAVGSVITGYVCQS